MFSDQLKLSITLAVGGETFVIPAGSVRALRVDARAHGFDASVSFIVSSEDPEDPDTFFPRFSSNDRIDLTLSLLVRPLEDPENASDRALSFAGIAVERRLVETVSRSIDGQPMYERLYEIDLVDPLLALWSEHRPVDLIVDACMRDALERHKPAGLELTYDFARLDDKQDVLFVPLPGDRSPSFYDFFIGFLAETHGVLERSAKTGSYRIGKKKSRILQPIVLDHETLDALDIAPSEPRRHKTRVLNHYADGKKTETLANDLAVRGVFRDVVAYTRVPVPFDRRVALEKARTRPGEHTIRATFKQCPSVLCPPGQGIELDTSVGESRYASKKTYRVITFSISARPEPEQEQETELGDEVARFELDLHVTAELASDLTPRLPRHAPTNEPVCIEGRVLSASGGDDDRTWFAAASDANGIWQLRCKIPLFNVDVVVPFEPGHDPGHFFFPPYKGQRVLVAFERDGARIDRYLDWAPNARTPMAAQGNRLALGYRDGNGTTLDHAYVDGKPVLTLERKFAGDHEVVTMLDQTLRFHVEELPSTESSTPKFDISPKVAAAKARLVGEMQASVGKITGSFEGSSGAVSASVEMAAAEVTAALEAAEAELTARIGGLRTELSSMGEALGEGPARIAAAAAEAKAAIKGALED